MSQHAVNVIVCSLIQATVKRSFSMETKKDKDEDKKADEDRDVESDAVKTEWPQTLSVKDLYYSVHLKGQHKSLMARLRSTLVKLSGKKVEKEDPEQESTLTLLHGVEAQFRRGRMCCLMGTSGAGKVSKRDMFDTAVILLHNGTDISCFVPSPV